MYTREYYLRREAAASHAAKAVLGCVLNAISVQSVCDVGCGTGTWIKVAREMGVEEALGFEGTWVGIESLVVPPDHIRRQDLENPIDVDRRFDLAICLEVAEHLSPARGPGLIADLCRLADAVLFSAAVPHQGGVGHMNEQWQGYWAALFEQHGYRPVDFVRPQIWSDERIPWWYRQNTLVYAASDSEAYARLASRAAVPAILDIVHPALYRRKEYPSVKQAAMRLVRAISKRHWR